MKQGAVILCGGRSNRMGRDKATLPFGPEAMLQRVVRLVGEAVPASNIVVVAAASQRLPHLPLNVLVARDAREFRGPLEGLATGLRALGDRADAVYATSCDVPLLVPAFVTQMFSLLADFEMVVPMDGLRFHPLAAVYRTEVLAKIETLLAAGQLRHQSLVDVVKARKVPVDEMRNVDPQLATLENVNFEADYRAALKAGGFNQGGALSGSCGDDDEHHESCTTGDLDD